MSDSNETFDQKFDKFFSRLSSMEETGKLTSVDLEHITDAFFIAPEKIADYLAACSQLTEVRAVIKAKADHGQQVPNPIAGQRGLDRTELVWAYRDLDASWRNVLATCENVEQIPELIREYLARRI